MLLSMLLAAPWFLFKAIRGFWHRFWQDSRSLPRSVWACWWRCLIVGFICTALFALGLTLLARSLPGLQTWDQQTLDWIIATAPMSFAQGVTWQSPGNLIGMLPVVITFTALSIWKARPLVAATVVFGYGLQFAFAWIGWGLWHRSRPTVIADGLAAPGLHSFPSGHALVVVTIYGLLCYLWFREARNGIERGVTIGVFLLWVGLVGLSRLVLGSHWVSDVLAGLAIGLVWLTFLIYSLHRAESRFIQIKQQSP